MRRKGSITGRITGWNDERGFGFIVPSAGGARTFVHISAFTNRRRRPRENELVAYTLATDPQARVQAIDVEFVGDPAWRAPAVRQVVYAMLTTTAFLGLLGAAAVLEIFPRPLFVLFLTASAMAFITYWRDKSAARASEWRTPESRLHVLGLLGGWPGSLVAMQLFRHKSSKRSFQVVFWLTVLANCGVLAWLTSASGERVLGALLRAA